MPVRVTEGARPGRPGGGPAGLGARRTPAASALRLQRWIGNRAVQDLVSTAQAAVEEGAALVGLGSELRIQGSVGRGGKNNPEDVALVRSRLSSVGYAPGDTAEELIAAIERYQADVVGLANPDGRVDVGGQTIRALAAWRGAAARPQKAGGGAPATSGAAPSPAGPRSGGEAPGAAGATGPAPAGPTGTASAPVTTAPPVSATGPRPVLQDPMLEKLVTATQNPKVDAVARELARLEALFASLKHSGYSEELGAARRDLVAAIGPLQAMINTLDQAGLDPSAAAVLKAQFHHAVNAISPYYFQHANIILEYAKGRGGERADVYNTCNITSLSMALEALGKSAADYTHSDLIPPIAAVFANDIEVKATGKVGKDLAGLRLPDYMAMCAIARAMRYKPGTRDDILNAMTTAFGNNKADTDHAIQNIGTLADLAHDFGANPKIGKFKLTPATKGDRDADTLSGWGKDHWVAANAAGDRLTALRNQLNRERDPTKQAALERQIAALAQSEAGAASDAGIEAKIPLDQYKRIVMAQIGPELDAGREVVVGQWHHFVRLQSIDENYIVKDDPGWYNRSNMTISWEQARAMGLFWIWLSIR